MSKFISAIVPNSEAELWLTKQQLIQKNKPTIAGTLLFADEPQASLLLKPKKLY
ncbi:hypothetical protein [Nostoc sp.]|uniref:hypothetical protein n=1 Tax=Nostoc sp. TaxID=1180 RepID=UPI002FF9F879